MTQSTPKDGLNSMLYCVLHALSDICATQSTPRDVLNSTFVLCSTRFEQHVSDTIDSEGGAKFNIRIVFYTLCPTCGRHNRLRGMGYILRLYCVLHALSDIWATQSTLRNGLTSTFVLCFTCFEQHLGYTIDPEGWATFYVCIMFYTL